MTIWAKNRSKFEAYTINKLQMSFSLYKIIKVLFKNKIFNDDFFKNMEKYTQSVRNIIFIAKVPRYTFEIVAVVSLTVLIFYLFSINNELGELLILLGLFVAAAFRILPAIVRIVISLQSIQSSMPSIKILLNEFTKGNSANIKKQKEASINFKKSLILKDINFKYPDSKTNVFTNLNLELKRKQIIGIAGASGSGKTTLIDVLMGLLKPDKGHIIVDGKKIKNQIKTGVEKLDTFPKELF